MSNPAPTDFQRGMLSSLEELACDVGAGFEPTLVEGRTENYYLIQLQRSDTQIQVYRYDDDDAGFSQGEGWHPYEIWDYSSLEEMQRAMLSELRRRLLSEAPDDELPQQGPSLISILGRWLRPWKR